MHHKMDWYGSCSPSFYPTHPFPFPFGLAFNYLPLPLLQPPSHSGDSWSIKLRKNSESHIDAFHSRQPLVKRERLMRYEVNAVMIFIAAPGSLSLIQSLDHQEEFFQDTPNRNHCHFGRRHGSSSHGHVTQHRLPQWTISS